MKSYKTFRELEREVRTPEAIARADQRSNKRLIEMDLKEMRQMLGLSQNEVAHVLKMTQPEISMIEGRADHRLSTLQKIVQALGGHLDVVATFGNKSIRLRSAG